MAFSIRHVLRSQNNVADSHPKDALRLGKYLVILEEPSALLFLLLLV